MFSTRIRPSRAVLRVSVRGLANEPTDGSGRTEVDPSGSRGGGRGTPLPREGAETIKSPTSGGRGSPGAATSRGLPPPLGRGRGRGPGPWAHESAGRGGVPAGMAQGRGRGDFGRPQNPPLGRPGQGRGTETPGASQAAPLGFGSGSALKTFGRGSPGPTFGLGRGTPGSTVGLGRGSPGPTFGQGRRSPGPTVGQGRGSPGPTIGQGQGSPGPTIGQGRGHELPRPQSGQGSQPREDSFGRGWRPGTAESAPGMMGRAMGQGRDAAPADRTGQSFSRGPSVGSSQSLAGRDTSAGGFGRGRGGPSEGKGPALWNSLENLGRETQGSPPERPSKPMRREGREDQKERDQTVDIESMKAAAEDDAGGLDALGDISSAFQDIVDDSRSVRRPRLRQPPSMEHNYEDPAKRRRRRPPPILKPGPRRVPYEPEERKIADRVWKLNTRKSEQIEKELEKSQELADHYEALLQQSGSEKFVTLVDEVENLLTDLPEGHWMRAYLRKAVHAVSKNSHLTHRDRTKFILSMVKVLDDVNQSIKAEELERGSKEPEAS